MRFARLLAAAALLALVVGPTASRAAEEHPDGCLTPAAARQAVAQGKALHFAAVKRSVETAVGGEILRARLCEKAGRLIYRLTVLKRDGEVVRLTVDAANGARSPVVPRHRLPRIERHKGAVEHGAGTEPPGDKN